MTRVQRRALFAAAVLVIGTAGQANAQLLGGGAGGAGAGAAAAGGADAGAAGGAITGTTGPLEVAGATVKPGLLQKIWARLTAIRRGLCASPAGQFLNGVTKPLTSMTGGIIPPFCPAMPSAADLKKPGVAGAANNAKKEALEAKERVAAVRFLGTLDCRYFPDASAALSAALRSDSNECVRYEAALMLNRGCCCNQKTIAALQASVAGTEEDGNPAERSVRVRCAAAAALERCLSCYVPPAPDEEPKPDPMMGEKPPGEKSPEELNKPREDDKKPTTDLKIKIPEIDKQTKKQLPPEQALPTKAQVERAAKVLAAFQQQLAAAQMVRPASATNGEQNSVFGIVKAVMQDTGTSSSQVWTANAKVMEPMPVSSAKMMPAPEAPVTARQIPGWPSKTGTMPAPEMPRVSVTSPNQPAFQPPPVAVRPTPTPLVEAPPVKPQPTEPVIAPVSAPPVEVPPAPVVTTPAIEPLPESPPRLVLPSDVPPATLPKQEATALQPLDSVSAIATRAETGATSADKHAAIRELVKHDWKDSPVVVQTLVKVAQKDADRVVRVDGIRHMAAYKMADEKVIALLQELSKDEDQWIAKEAAEALTKMKD